MKDLIDSQTAYFHMAAWSIPAILTIIILAMNLVEADSVYGNISIIILAMNLVEADSSMVIYLLLYLL